MQFTMIPWKKGKVVMSANQLEALESLIRICYEQESLQSNHPDEQKHTLPNESPPATAEQEHTPPNESPPATAEHEYIPPNESPPTLNNPVQKQLVRFEETMNILNWSCFWTTIGLACYYFATGECAKAVTALSSAISIARSIIKHRKP